MTIHDKGINEISYEETRDLYSPVYIDVRAPVEFGRDHIPGAVNMPLFDNEERDEIGKIYKLIGKENAVVRGSEIAGLKIGDIVSRIQKIRDRDIVIYCFRGGMRSTTLISLLGSLGCKIYKLKDGYKGYRRYVNSAIRDLDIKPRLFVLHGLTGTGKTEILKNIENSIDLEGLAGHRSSVFGGIGLKQRTQKMFESLLLSRISALNECEYIVTEGESRKIGDLHIPDRLLGLMYDSPGILINAPVERRVEIILREYKEKADAEEVAGILKSIESRIGKKNADLLIELYRKGDLSGFVNILLLKYYDPLYRHTLKKIGYAASFVNTDSAKCAEEIMGFINDYIQ